MLTFFLALLQLAPKWLLPPICSDTCRSQILSWPWAAKQNPIKNSSTKGMQEPSLQNQYPLHALLMQCKPSIRERMFPNQYSWAPHPAPGESNLYLVHVVGVGDAGRACVEKAALQISQHLSGLGQRALQLPEQGAGLLQDTEREPKLWKDLLFF